MTNHDIVASTDVQQVIRRYSDSDLLAFWAATETVQDAAEMSPTEAAMIEIAAQELVKRGLLPV